MDKLSLEDFQSLHHLFTEDVFDIFKYEKSVENRNAIGGTSRKTVEAQISLLEKWLN